MSRFDRVILSTNEDRTYFEFWPHVSKAWKHLFGVKVSLAVVTNKSENDPWIKDLKRHGDVVLFREIQQVPTPNLSQVVRHILASQYGSEVCMINDIDLLPLQTDWYLDRLENRQPGQVLALGGEFFKGGPDEGKFPMGYVTAEGSTWREIVNPANLSYQNLVTSWIGTRVVDHKEDISKTTWYEYKDAFADESLMRVWLNRWGHADRVVHVPWSFKPGIDSADRSKWNVDVDKLKAGGYVEAHMPRPFSKFRKQIDPLLQYVYNL
jgi:hypothetical protein